SGEERLLAGIVNARATLAAGVTTVADLDAGFDSWPVIVLRDAIAAGEIAGPTILAAGSSISPTGGHGDHLDGPDQVLELFTSSGLCDGVSECRRAVRRQHRQGADLIKIHATGGGNERTGGKHHAPSFMMDELRAIVETAHSLELKTAAHAHATAGINAALRAGVDSIEHGSFLDDESIRLFNSSGAYLVPTLSVQDMIANVMDTVPAYRRPRLQLYQQEHPANFLRAYQAGVKIAMGSDAGVVPHGNNAREVEWLVKAGVSAAEALRIATLGSADHLGLAQVTGKLAAGMEADVIAVEGNPLEDITALYEVVFVMTDGSVYKSMD
ncbi:MAG: amidohydrolase family protein, partial [Gammaproteobacteria bacterium]|nr:amidohydrolase family protein [Gammaproteobacteria bacterium]